MKETIVPIIQIAIRALFSALGAAILYHQWGRSELRAYALSLFFDTVEFKSSKMRDRVEMITFVAVGMLIAMGVAKPQSVPQAFAAGAGFTGLVAKPRTASEAQNQASKAKARGPKVK